MNRRFSLLSVRTGATMRSRWLAFGGVAVFALIAIAVGALIASRAVARNEALKDAERMTTRLANHVVAPLLAPALAGDPTMLAELNREVHSRMADGDLIEIVVWAGDGRVLYTDEAHKTTGQLLVPERATAAINQGVVSSEFADEPEITNPGSDPTIEGFVEVYLPFHLDGQPPLAFEAYYDYRRVTEIANSILTQMLPVVLIPLLVLQLIQVPIALSLARRLRTHEVDRAAMLERTLTGLERERIKIAADLHDGPIQDLAGIGYALGAVEPGVATAQRPLMRDVVTSLHRAIESLRRMMVDLYPPDLSTAQLPNTIAALTVPLREVDVEVEVEIPEAPLPPLDPDTVTALYRVARESLANVKEHAQASRVRVTLDVASDDSTSGGRPTVCLTVTDDGIGVDPLQLDRRAQGHLGLRLLDERVRALGGTLKVAPGKPHGTVVSAALPIPRSVVPAVDKKVVTV